MDSHVRIQHVTVSRGDRDSYARIQHVIPSSDNMDFYMRIEHVIALNGDIDNIPSLQQYMQVKLKYYKHLHKLSEGLTKNHVPPK